jgi:flagellar biosynthetic protein FliR
MIGVILGFFIQLIFASFSTAGQFFAFQMGLSAGEVYDSLSQVENPLMGQFFNFMAMLIFFQTRSLHSFFFRGIYQSFRSINVFSLLNHSDFLLKYVLQAVSMLFKDALMIALPVMASLFLINVTVGILSKAAPQMNLLSEGFPVLMIVAYALIVYLIPQFAEYFYRSFLRAFSLLERIFAGIKWSGA